MKIPQGKGRVLALTGLLAAGLSAAMPGRAAAEWRASPWIDLQEAKIRLLLDKPAPGAAIVRAAVQMQLAPDFKTYWRSPGDSGVPPNFDFSGSVGLGAPEAKFPMPQVLDDGAGGVVWGYKSALLLPIEAKPAEGPLMMALKLDFAVCGTLCIPLSGEFRLAAEGGEPAGPEIEAAYAAAKADVPRQLSPEEAASAIRVKRLAAGSKPVWELAIKAKAGDDFAAFPEGKGFFQVSIASPAADGTRLVRLEGEAAPGSAGQFGPVRLTFGGKGNAREAVIDLDGAALAN